MIDEMKEPVQNVDPGAIAIVGMAGRFPGARSVDELWENLRSGVESIRRLEPDELRRAGVPEDDISDPDYVPATAGLDDPKRFDASFFGYLPREAEVMDPQQRHFLECAWEALESAGYDPARSEGRIGIFGGVARNTYLLEILRRAPDFLERLGEYEGLIGSEKDFLATRVAYKLDLRGPAVDVQSACSTSGVALHLACQSLLTGECDMALAGGGRILVPLDHGYRYEEGGILSPDGRCRAFDAGARGTVRGSGMAFVVVKRLQDALADEDFVHAVIRGTAVNNDGAEKAGFTAPGVRGQAEVIAEALAVAGVGADSIGYVEAHGTGTAVGDPIEVAALTRAFRETTDRTGYCALGSVKTNLGHLDAGAAVTGVIKAALALRYGEIPPSLHFEEPNPEIAFEGSPFFVADELRPWPRGETPRRAGVSSFGLGGTNFHAVLEEAPERPVTTDGDAPSHHLLVLSARDGAALDDATERLASHLEERPGARIGDVAHTLQVGRRAFEHRRAVVCRGLDDAPSALRTAAEEARPDSAALRSGEMPLVFLFPGGGAQHPGMGRELHRDEPVYRRALERCLGAMDEDLRERVGEFLLDGNPGSEGADGSLEGPSLALPALFATEYALARLLVSWGLEPAALVGHSMGEYAAACLAGVFTVDDAVALVALRGRLFETTPSGAMTAVPLPADEIEALELGGLSVAAENRPDACVVSGHVSAIETLEERMEARGVECRRLHIDVAAHSPLVDSILEPFRRFVEEEVELNRPDLPFLSNVTGTWIRDGEATDPEYWVRHIRETVRFAPALAELFAGSPAALVEVGPGRTLTSFAAFHPDRGDGHPTVSTMPHPTEEVPERVALLEAVGRLWTHGVDVDWTALGGAGSRRRVPLPTYPFQGRPHWVDALETGRVGGRDMKGREDAETSTFPEEKTAFPEQANPSPAPTTADPSSCVRTIREQLDTMHRQLELLRYRGSGFDEGER